MSAQTVLALIPLYHMILQKSDKQWIHYNIFFVLVNDNVPQNVTQNLAVAHINESCWFFRPSDHLYYTQSLPRSRAASTGRSLLNQWRWAEGREEDRAEKTPWLTAVCRVCVCSRSQKGRKGELTRRGTKREFVISRRESTRACPKRQISGNGGRTSRRTLARRV